MTTTTFPPRSGVLADCVRTATAAPSVHNSQPWIFQVGGSAVDVYADPSRRLRVLDPLGRELMISVGAALFTLRLAIRQAGYRSDVRLFPDPDEPDLVARVTPTHPAEVTPAVEALAAAIEYRHTNRFPFNQVRVPGEVLDQLRDAARWEGAVLAVANEVGRDAVLGLARSADRWLHGQPGYRAELARWTDTGSRHDGVPPWAVGPRDALGAVPIRDFGELSGSPRQGARFEPYPTIVVLATAGDRPPDWIRAGQALQRVLLAATWKGLAATPISQPVEVPAVRRRLLEPSTGLSVQMVLRIGYGTTTGATPRRRLAEVLLSRPHSRRSDRAKVR